MTFLDLPREVISQILRRLPDHVSLLETAKAHETFEALVDREGKLWETLCRFHFTQEQIEKQKVCCKKFFVSSRQLAELKG